MPLVSVLKRLAETAKQLEQLRIHSFSLSGLCDESQFPDEFIPIKTMKTLSLGWKSPFQNEHSLNSLTTVLCGFCPNLENIIFENDSKSEMKLDVDHFRAHFPRLVRCQFDRDKIDYLGRHKQWYLEKVVKKKMTT